MDSACGEPGVVLPRHEVKLRLRQTRWPNMLSLSGRLRGFLCTVCGLYHGLLRIVYKLIILVDPLLSEIYKDIINDEPSCCRQRVLMGVSKIHVGK